MAAASGERPSENFLKANNARHIWHPMVRPAATREQPPIIISEGDGVFVADVDGKRYLDAMGGLWNVNVGHNRPELKRAIVEQLDRIAYYSTFVNTSNPPSIELSARLVELLEPEGMTRVMYSSGGSDAVETALKLARQYFKLVGQPERTKVISLKYGYHGVHFGGLSANGNPAFRRAYEPLMPGFIQIENPYVYRNPWSSDPDEVAVLCADQLDREIRYQGPDTVAAFIAEPVQGAGGVIVPPARYWPLIREVCDRHGVLLVADEIVTGFGRTGALFGVRGWGVTADIMCFAKGINSGYVPLGATAVSAKVAAAWDSDSPFATIMHGYTYSGHPLACAAANAALEIVIREKLTENAAAQGAHLLGRLMPFRERFNSVGDVRGKGLMIGIELVRDKATKEPLAPTDPLPPRIAQHCLDNGVMIRANANRLILSPPLVVERQHVDAIADALEAAFAANDR